jgi:hypothetical protein
MGAPLSCQALCVYAAERCLGRGRLEDAMPPLAQAALLAVNAETISGTSARRPSHVSMGQVLQIVRGVGERPGVALVDALQRHHMRWTIICHVRFPLGAKADFSRVAGADAVAGSHNPRFLAGGEGSADFLNLARCQP